MSSRVRRTGASAGPAAGDSLFAETSGPSSSVWDYLRILVRHRWWAVAGMVLAGVPLLVFTMVTTPVYLASTRLVLGEDEENTFVGLSANQQRPVAMLDSRTLAEVVRSRGLVREAVAALELWKAPEFAEALVGTTTDDERAQALVGPFLDRLSVSVPEQSRLMTISFEAEDPALAARVVNLVADTYINRDRESRFRAANASADWLANRLKEQRGSVASAEAALQNYRAQQDAISLSDRQNIVGQKLTDLNSAVTRAKTDRILRETQYQGIAAVRGDPAALENHPLVASNAFVQTLRGQVAELTRQDAQLSDRLGPKHPDRIKVNTELGIVESRLRAEVAKVVDGIETEYRAAVAQEASLTQALNAQKSEAFSLDRKGVEYAALEREAASARQVFDALLQQTKEAALTSDVQRTTIRVVDAAEPPAVPIRPRKRQGYAAAAMLGLIGGLGSAAGREYLRRRITSPADLEQRLGLPVLALVPPTSEDEAKSTTLAPLPAEAFRRLRANVMLGCESTDIPGNILVVTSAAPGEGKSFVSAHLALALAAVDQRVVLVDADLRRPRLHTIFDRQRSPGLADVLLGRRNAAEVLRPVNKQGLVLVPSGLPAGQAAELLSLHAFRRFLDGLRSDFDWIIIDSPPVMAVSDAAVLAHDATGVLFVASADLTSLEAAESAITELDAAGARIVGAVLNRAPITREAFYYSRYYRPEYAQYLAEEGEAQSEPLEATVR